MNAISVISKGVVQMAVNGAFGGYFRDSEILHGQNVNG